MKKVCAWLLAFVMVAGMTMPVEAKEPGEGYNPTEYTAPQQETDLLTNPEDESAENAEVKSEEADLEETEPAEAEPVEVPETEPVEVSEAEPAEVSETEPAEIPEEDADKADVIETKSVPADSSIETEAVSYKLVLNPAEVTLKEGETCKLSYSMEPEEPKDVVYTYTVTNNGSVAFDEETMTITAVGAGKGTVRVSAKYTKEDGKTASTSQSCNVTVEKAEGDTEILLNGSVYQVDDSAEKSNLQQAVEAAQISDYRDIKSIEFRSGVIRKEDFDFISEMEDTLQYGLQSFVIDDAVQAKGLINNAVPYGAFKVSTTSYRSLTTVYLGVNIKRIEKQAFYGCTAITNFEAPGVEYVGESALNRIRVNVLSLPSVTRIDAEAFGDMKRDMTTEVYLPSLNTMGISGGAYDALECFTKLKKLTLGENPPKLTKALKLASGVAENLELVIPRGAVSNYQASEYYDAGTNTWCGIKLPEQKQYVVTVNVDGQTQEITLPYEYSGLGDLMPEAPVKDGYVFLGWNTAEDGSGDVVTADTPITGDITIYAVFRQEYVYNVIFVVDGKETTVQVTESDAVIRLPKDPVKDGYIFKGWNTKADGTGTAVTDGTAVTADIKVYAIFEKKADAGTGDNTDNNNKGEDNNTPGKDKNKDNQKPDDSNEKTSVKAVQTGDNSVFAPSVITMLIAGAVIVVLVRRKRYTR